MKAMYLFALKGPTGAKDTQGLQGAWGWVIPMGWAAVPERGAEQSWRSQAGSSKSPGHQVSSWLHGQSQRAASCSIREQQPHVGLKWAPGPGVWADGPGEAARGC